MEPQLRRLSDSATPIAAGIVLASLAAAPENSSPKEKTVQRSRLTARQQLHLVRLCCERGEEYSGPKENFWAKRTAEFNRVTGKSVASARTIVTRLYREYLAKAAEVLVFFFSFYFLRPQRSIGRLADQCLQDDGSSSNAWPEEELGQALAVWHDWVKRASETKSSGKAAAESGEDARVQRARMDRENILLPISRKRSFSDSMATLDDGGDIEDSDGDGTPGRPPKKQTPSWRKEKDDNSETEEEMERALALDERFAEQGDRLIAAVTLVASKLGSGGGAASPSGVRAESLSGSERGRMGKLEAELKASREAMRELGGLVGEMAERINTTENKIDAKLDRILGLLQEMRNKAPSSS